MATELKQITEATTPINPANGEPTQADEPLLRQDELEEFNRLAERMIHSLDRMHLLNQEILHDLRATRQAIAEAAQSQQHSS
ncbi:MAG: hypothetical protein M3347_04195 [Armatimonadota bacterium]|nr:hypothetical protein [Armatimonadota bacterium]